MVTARPASLGPADGECVTSITSPLGVTINGNEQPATSIGGPAKAVKERLITCFVVTRAQRTSLNKLVRGPCPKLMPIADSPSFGVSIFVVRPP